jgi:hypothetical protein
MLERHLELFALKLAHGRAVIAKLIARALVMLLARRLIGSLIS